MFKKLRIKNKGFSIVEVVVSAVIFAIAAAGLIAMSSATRPQAVKSENEVLASFYARQVLDDLRGKIDAATWVNGLVSPGTYNQTFGDYSVTWVITNDANSTGRYVDMTVQWTEP